MYENGVTELFQYNLYTNIFDVNEKSRLFLVQEVDDEKYQIMFGDNVLGRKPGNGAIITVTYIVTDGEEGNGAANFNFAGRLTYLFGGADEYESSILLASNQRPTSPADANWKFTGWAIPLKTPARGGGG